MTDTAELRRLNDDPATTPRPWQLARDMEGGTHFIARFGGGGGGPNYYADSYYPNDEADGQLVVAAVNALPALLDENERLREALKQHTKRQEAALALFRREKVVFDGSGGRWEKLAMTLYSNLVESAVEAEAVLTEGAKE